MLSTEDNDAMVCARHHGAPAIREAALFVLRDMLLELDARSGRRAVDGLTGSAGVSGEDADGGGGSKGGQVRRGDSDASIISGIVQVRSQCVCPDCTDRQKPTHLSRLSFRSVTLHPYSPFCATGHQMTSAASVLQGGVGGPRNSTTSLRWAFSFFIVRHGVVDPDACIVPLIAASTDDTESLTDAARAQLVVLTRSWVLLALRHALWKAQLESFRSQTATFGARRALCSRLWVLFSPAPARAL